MKKKKIRIHEKPSNISDGILKKILEFTPEWARNNNASIQFDIDVYQKGADTHASIPLIVPLYDPHAGTFFGIAVLYLITAEEGVREALFRAEYVMDEMPTFDKKYESEIPPTPVSEVLTRIKEEADDLARLPVWKDFAIDTMSIHNVPVTRGIMTAPLYGYERMDVHGESSVYTVTWLFGLTGAMWNRHSEVFNLDYNIEMSEP